MDPQLERLLSQHKRHFTVQDNGKIKCGLNGHCFPARYDVLKAFISGSKYQKLAVRAEAANSLAKYEPFIVQSRNFPLMLYCALTGQLVDKSVEAVKLHMKGKKFQRAKERFQADDQGLRPEPTIESLGFVPKKGSSSKQQQEQEQEAGEDGAQDGEQAPARSSAGSSDSEGDEGEGAGELTKEEQEDMQMLLGSGAGDGGSDPMEASVSDSEGEEGGDAMEEDPPPRKAPLGKKGALKGKKAAATAAAAAVGKGSGHANGSGRTRERKHGKQNGNGGAAAAAAGGGGALDGGSADGSMARKRNVNRPSAAKKARK